MSSYPYILNRLLRIGSETRQGFNRTLANRRDGSKRIGTFCRPVENRAKPHKCCDRWRRDEGRAFSRVQCWLHSHRIVLWWLRMLWNKTVHIVSTCQTSGRIQQHAGLRARQSARYLRSFTKWHIRSSRATTWRSRGPCSKRLHAHNIPNNTQNRQT